MERFEIEIESKGDYDRKKEFSLIAEMSERDYIALCSHIMDFFESMDNSADIVQPAEKEKKA